MIISEVEYHLVLLPTISTLFNEKTKSDLFIIIPDVLLQFKGGVKKMTASRDEVQVNFSSSPDVSPKEIAETLVSETSTRLTRVNPELASYKSVFRDSYLIKTGAKPTRAQVKDFIHLSINGL